MSLQDSFMAQPLKIDRYPWKTRAAKGGKADFELSSLTGWYQDGTKEVLALWRLSLWERLKVLLTGKVVLHSLSQLLVHKISVDYAHVAKMEKAWNGGGRENRERLENSNEAAVSAAVVKHFSELRGSKYER